MTRTKIDWTDFSHNPVTGCFGRCPYCYAAKTARRFARRGVARGRQCETGKVHVLDEPVYFRDKHGKERISPFPFGFDPTFHRYRLDGLEKVKKPSRVFIGSMADVFGDWVDGEWIQEVFNACARSPQHKYIFLTKNPKRYRDLAGRDMLPHGSNYWWGTTVTRQKDKAFFSANGKYNTFLSIEPIFDTIILENFSARLGTSWVIIGGETGNREGKVVPQREWLKTVVDDCKTMGIPLLMKSNLEAVWNRKLVQKFPKGLLCTSA